jgi:hypothetical protein
MGSKYLLTILLLSCLLIISSCSGNNDQETIVTQQEDLSISSENVSETTITQADSPNQKQIETTSKPSKTINPKKELCVDDFNAGAKPNCLGGDLGAFDYMPDDFSQSCLEAYDPGVKHDDVGFSMRLDYDVDSKNPAFNGFWMKLANLDATGYSKIVFWVKGDVKHGFTDVFKVELKNSLGETGKYYVKNVTNEWKKIEIPLKDFAFITDFSDLTELVIVFEDRIVSAKEGTIWVDDIYFVE